MTFTLDTFFLKNVMLNLINSWIKLRMPDLNLSKYCLKCKVTEGVSRIGCLTSLICRCNVLNEGFSLHLFLEAFWFWQQIQQDSIVIVPGTCHDCVLLVCWRKRVLISTIMSEILEGMFYDQFSTYLSFVFLFMVSEEIQLSVCHNSFFSNK